MADQLFKRKKIAVERRQQNVQKRRSQSWLFVCEGERTEPNYIKSLIEYCNQLSEEAPIKATIIGTGRNTQSLVDFLDRTLEYKSSADIPYEKIFVLFDRDSFKEENFNNAVENSKRRGYIPIWSNECFELWFLLHFDYLDADISREAYFDKLSKLFGGKYNKTDDIFSKIHSEESLKRAYHNAVKLNEKWECEGSYANRKPCTQMPKLIHNIEDKLKIKLT